MLAGARPGGGTPCVMRPVGGTATEVAMTGPRPGGRMPGGTMCTVVAIELLEARKEDLAVVGIVGDSTAGRGGRGRWAEYEVRGELLASDSSEPAWAIVDEGVASTMSENAPLEEGGVDIVMVVVVQALICIS